MEDAGIDTGERLAAVLVRLIEIIFADDTLLRDVQAGRVAGDSRQGDQDRNDGYNVFFHIA